MTLPWRSSSIFAMEVERPAFLQANRYFPHVLSRGGVLLSMILDVHHPSQPHLDMNITNY